MVFIFDISCEQKKTRPNFKTRIAKDVQQYKDDKKSIKPINKYLHTYKKTKRKTKRTTAYSKKTLLLYFKAKKK